MAKFKIDVTEENCTGCLRCQLACSNQYTGAFNPEAARLIVDLSNTFPAISFTDECISCGICVDNCLFETLQKTKREEPK